MGTESKSKLLSLRLSPNHYEYVRLQARERNMSVSEFVRIIIERAENEFRHEGPLRTEVVAYLKNLSAPQREDLLDNVDSGEKRKIILYMNNILEKNPETTVKKLCESTSIEFNVPVNLDLRRTADLRIRSYRTKRKFVERLEKENEQLL